MKSIKIFLLVISFFASPFLWAYPEFIGFGYTACMTCHYNGAGGGALNDYGRGLFAAEIAAKILWNKNKTDDELSEASGFLGKEQFPYWFRPSIKFRGLHYMMNPGEKDRQSINYYPMQKDINVHLAFNQEQTLLLGFNLSSLYKANYAYPNTPFEGTLLASREYYLRGQLSESLWAYIGFLDKVYGIRHPDHTAINRTALDLGQNNQVHGLILHYADEKKEFFLNPFVGNLRLPKESQYPGVALHYEYEPAERWRLGVSFLRDRNAGNLQSNKLGLLIKRGLGNGHSVLGETGINQTTSLTNKDTISHYIWTQSTLRLARGVFLQSNMEYNKEDISRMSLETLKLALGVVMFPFQKFEWRLSAQDRRMMDPDHVTEDIWNLQSQVHLAF